MSTPASPESAASPEARRRIVQRTITQHWRAHNAADSDDEGGDDDADSKPAAVDPASMCCCNSCACCEARVAQMFDFLRKVTNVSEHVSTSTLSFYSPYLEVAFSLWVERTQAMAVKNVIRIASIAFIIFFMQDFLSFPIVSVIIFRGATIVLGLLFLIAFRYKPEWFKGSALLLPYGFVVWFYGFFIIVAANIRTQLVPDYVTFSPAFVLWTLVVFVMGKLTFKQSSIIVGINLVLGFISYVHLASIKKLSPAAFFSDIMCFLSISVSGAWGAYMHELGARSNFMDLYSSERVGADGASSSSSSASDALGSPSPTSPGSELSRAGSTGTPELTHAPSWQRDRSNESRRGSGSAAPSSSRRGSHSRRSSVAKLQEDKAFMSNAFADLLWDDSLAEKELDSAIEARNSIALAVHPAGADADAAHPHRHENSAAATVAAPVVKSLMASFRRQLTAQSAAIVASAEADANTATAGIRTSADQAADAATEASLAAMSPMQRAFAESPALMRILMHHRTLQQQKIVADQLRRQIPLQPSIESIKRSKAEADAEAAMAAAAAAAEAEAEANTKAAAPVSAFSLKRQRTLQGSSGAVASYLADSLGGGSISARGEHSALQGTDRLPSVKRSATNTAAATMTATVPARPATLQDAKGLSRNFLKQLLRARADNFTQQFERTRSNSLKSAAAASAASAAAALNDITEEPVAPHVESASSDEPSTVVTARSSVVVDLRALGRSTSNSDSTSSASSLALQIDDATIDRASTQLVVSPVAGDSLLSGAAASVSPAPAHTPLPTAPSLSPSNLQSQSSSSMTPRAALTSSSSGVHLSFESSTTTSAHCDSTILSSPSSLPPLPPLSPMALALAAGPITSADSSATTRHAAAVAPSHNSASYPVFRANSQQQQQGDDAIDSAWAATLKQSMVERGMARRHMSVGAPLPQHIKPIERFRKVSRRVLQSVRISRVFERQMQSLSHFLDRRSMTFTDEGIEDGFALAHISSSGNRILLLLFINIFTTILFVVQDYFTSPLNFLSTLVPIRFFVIVPALAVAALTVQLLSHRPFYMQCIMCTCFITVAVGYILQLFSMPKEQSESALTGVLRIVFLMATSFSIQYRIVVVAQWIIVVTLPVVGALKGFDVATIVYQVLYLLVLAVCLSWVCYSNERDWKFRFYMDPFFQVLFLQEGEFEQGMEDELDGLADASEPLSLDSVADLSTAAAPAPIVSA